jgi:hypothetical protein
VRVLLVPVTLAGLLAGLETATASAATCVSWSGTPAQNSAVPDNVLTATSVLSACDVWAVGDFTGTGGANLNVILHWNGTKWAQVPSPDGAPSDNLLNGVAAASASSARAAPRRGVIALDVRGVWPAH